jgi:hypothetical protein
MLTPLHRQRLKTRGAARRLFCLRARKRFFFSAAYCMTAKHETTRNLSARHTNQFFMISSGLPAGRTLNKPTAAWGGKECEEFPDFGETPA